jgi:hypothetical protein
MGDFSGRFAIGMPTYGDMESKTRASVMSVLKKYRNVHWVNVQGYSDVSRARTEVAARLLALPTKPEFHLWVDGDMVFNVDDVERLLTSIQERPDAGLVGSLYWNRNGTLFTAKDLQVPHGTEIPVGTTGEVIPYLGGGFGLTVVRSNVYDKLDAPDHPETGKHWFFPCLDDKGQPLSEDLSFCYRVHKAELGVYLDTAVTPGHITKRPLWWWNGPEPVGPEKGTIMWAPVEKVAAE